jgi:hypothetical protein
MVFSELGNYFKRTEKGAKITAVSAHSRSTEGMACFAISYFSIQGKHCIFDLHAM